MDKDPLSIAVEALEQFLQESPAIKLLVNAKNVEGYTTLRGTKTPDVLGESDLPRIHLMPKSGPVAPNLASNLAFFDLAFEVQIISGDRRFTYDMLPVVFAVFAACTDAVHDSALTDLEWQGVKFVRDIALSNIDTGFRSPDGTQRGINGTTSVCSLTLYLEFPQTKLVTWNRQT